MNKKIIFVLILFVAIASLSCVSAWWIFGGGGTDVTVNGVDFSIPDGFEYYELAGNPETETQYALYSDDGKQALAFIHIRVSEGAPDTFGKQYSYKTTINGKECYITIGNPILCIYQSNGKFVQLNVPKSYTYHNQVISYEETLEQIIK